MKLEEVFIIRQKLEKITKSGGGQDQALDLLERLGEIDMNFAILKETMIGFTVHALKKSSSDEEIILKSKTLIKVCIIESITVGNLRLTLFLPAKNQPMHK